MMLLTTSQHEKYDPFGLFNGVKYVNDPKDVKDGVLILWGGEDIGTKLYKQQPNKFCYTYEPSNRDNLELSLIHAAVENDVPIIGICRGAQLLCVASGGTLAQHIEGHGSSHKVVLHDEGDAVISCNSSHHQMMIPDSYAKILATTNKPTFSVTENNTTMVYPQCNEVVYFPITNGLGIQPHPEWDNCPQEFIDYCSRKIKEYLL